MHEYDVLVVGGGNAGCAAALAAARHGARTMLVERYGFLGGTATASMVGPWMTFHSGGERIVGGIAQEIVERLVRRGGSPGHIGDSSDYVATITPFDPEMHKALLFEMMHEAKVHLLLHSWFLRAEVEGDAHNRCDVCHRRRRAIVSRETVIDTTADAYVAASAGVETQQGDARGRVQPASLMFRLSHVDLTKTATYVRMHVDQMRSSLKAHERTAPALTAVAGLYDLWRQAKDDGIVDIPRELVSFFISPYPDEVTVNMTRVTNIDPLDPDDLTRAEVEARLQVMQLLRFFRERVPGFENARLAATGAQVGIRESRRIVGRYTLDRRRRAACAAVRRRRRAQRLPDRHSQPVGKRHDDAPPAARRELRDSLSLFVAGESRADARRRTLHFDDARSACIDASDADGHDARSSSRNCRRAREEPSCARVGSRHAQAPRDADCRRSRPTEKFVNPALEFSARIRRYSSICRPGRLGRRRTALRVRSAGSRDPHQRARRRTADRRPSSANL